jgi:hypothetical protein
MDNSESRIQKKTKCKHVQLPTCFSRALRRLWILKINVEKEKKKNGIYIYIYMQLYRKYGALLNRILSFKVVYTHTLSIFIKQ